MSDMPSVPSAATGSVKRALRLRTLLTVPFVLLIVVPASSLLARRSTPVCRLWISFRGN